MTDLHHSDRAADDPASVVPPEQLTRRASLTFVSNILLQVSRLLTQFIVTPILIRGLGVPLYGAWVMIQQTVGYFAAGDMRPMATLKFTLAVRQHVMDEDEKRRMVGAAMRIWFYTLPILVTVGAVLVWFTPSFIRLSAEHVAAVRIAMAIVVVHVMLDRVLSLPSNVLVGSNLEYRSMGLNAVSMLLTGLLTAVAVLLGYGLIGVAAATVVGAAIYSTGRFFVARRAVSWFGMAPASRTELIEFAKLSGWLTFSGLSNLLLTSADVLILGIVFGPAAAAVYGTTAAVLRIALGPLSELLASGSIGIAGLCARQEWSRVAKLRLEMHLVAIVIMTVVGVGVIALNREFLRLWTQRDLYAGTAVNVLLVLGMLGALLYRADRVIAASMMEFRIQATSVAAISVLSLVAGTFAAMRIGPAAIAGAVAVANVGVMIALARRISQRSNGIVRPRIVPLVRPLAVAAVLFTGAVVIEQHIRLHGWFMLALSAAVLASVTFATMITAGLRRPERTLLAQRVQQSIRSVTAAAAGRRR